MIVVVLDFLHLIILKQMVDKVGNLMDITLLHLPLLFSGIKDNGMIIRKDYISILQVLD